MGPSEVVQVQDGSCYVTRTVSRRAFSAYLPMQLRWPLLDASVIVSCTWRKTAYFPPPTETSSSLQVLLCQWTHPGFLESSYPWQATLPTLYVATDSTDIRWGLQSSAGHHREGKLHPFQQCWHINACKLAVVLSHLHHSPSIRARSVCFQIDNQVAIQCVNKFGSSRSRGLQWLTCKWDL